MTDHQPSPADKRDALDAAVEALRAGLPTMAESRLIDLDSASDQALEEVLQLSEDRLAVVLLRVRYDAIYREDGPPPPAPPELEALVESHAAGLVRSNVRDSDLVVRVGPGEQAVLLLQSGPLEARTQVGRLRPLVANERFTYRGYEIQWRGRLSLATYQGAASILGARRVLQHLFTTASEV